jgi:hypothetical protein
VTASSEDGANLAKHVTEPKTWENYLNTRWQSTAGDTQWVMVDLGAAMDVNRVILKWDAAAAKTFKIQTSTDGASWTDDFSTMLGSSSAITDETFKTTSARYVRLYATQRAPLPLVGRGGGFGPGRGRGPTTAPSGAAGQQAARAPVATQPAAAGYSLYELMVLKD